MNADQSVVKWAWVIVITSASAAALLLYLAFFFIKAGVAAIGGRYGGISVSRKSQPLQFWFIIACYMLVSFVCSEACYRFYCKFLTVAQP